MGRSAFLVGVASSPSGRGQTLPLQAQTRASGMIYNCSTKLREETSLHRLGEDPVRVVSETLQRDVA
jgi:hypothetical protein